MVEATARFSVDALLETNDPQGHLTLIVAQGLFDGEEPSLPIDVRYRQPTVPLAQYRAEETGVAGTDGSLETLYDAGFDADRVLQAAIEGELDTETYDWGNMLITAEMAENNRMKLTLEVQDA